MIEKLQRDIIKRWFKQLEFNKDIKQMVVDLLWGIYSNDGVDNIMWDDIKPYDKMIQAMYDDFFDNGLRYNVSYYYEELIDWADDKSYDYLDYEIGKKREIIKVEKKNNVIEKMFKLCDIKYQKNIDYEDEYLRCKEEAEDEYKKDLKRGVI